MTSKHPSTETFRLASKTQPAGEPGGTWGQTGRFTSFFLAAQSREETGVRSFCPDLRFIVKDELPSARSIAAHPCKKRKDGAPSLEMARADVIKGGPPGEVVISGTDPNRYKFNGKERDPESGLDDFDARFYSSPCGRFMTPDWAARPTAVPYAVFGDPQSLNLYGYVRNDPVSRADADGHEGVERDAFHSDQPCGVANACGSMIGNEVPPGSFGGNKPSWENKAAGRQAQNTTPTLKGVPSKCQGCTSEKKAAIAAEKAAVGQTRAAAKHGKYEEWGGWIITKDGKNFTYTVPVTFGDPGHFFTDNVTIPNDYAEVADYHTHPDPSSVGEGFSTGDMARAERNQMNAYVGMSYSGNVRQYVPGKTKDKGLNGVSGDLIYTIP